MKHAFELDQVVEVLDKDRLTKDELLEDLALEIIKTNDYKGTITKIEDNIYFVGFKNDLGWVTQGFKANEIGGVKYNG